MRFLYRALETLMTEISDSAILTKLNPVGLASMLRKPAPFIVLILFAVLNVWSVCRRLPGRVNRQDFSIYYASAATWRQGRNPYTTDFRLDGLETGDIRTATHTPTFLICIEPLARLSESRAFYLWIGINVVFL